MTPRTVVYTNQSANELKLLLGGFKTALNGNNSTKTMLSKDAIDWFSGIINSFSSVVTALPNYFNQPMHAYEISVDLAAKYVDLQIQYTKYKNFMKSSVDNKVNILKLPTYETYQSLVANLDDSYQNYCLKLTEFQSTYMISQSDYAQLARLYETIKAVTIAMADPKYLNDQNVRAFNVMKESQLLPLVLILRVTIHQHKELLKTFFTDDNTPSAYSKCDELLNDPKVQDILQAVKTAIDNFNQQKAMRDAKMAEMKARQQHGLMPAPSSPPPSPPGGSPGGSPPRVGAGSPLANRV